MGFSVDDFGGFDSSGGFSGNSGNTNSFDDGFSGGFDDGFGSGFDSGFDSGFGDNSNSGFNNTSNGAGNEFEGMFSDTPGDTDDNDSSNLKKTAILAVVAGVVVILGGLALATALKNKDASKPNENGVTIVEQPTQQGPTQLPPTQNANDILQSGNEPYSNTTVHVNNTNNNVIEDSSWTIIDDKQNVVFEGEYRELIFCVTETEHRAKKSASTVIIETIARGSLSGMSGTYEMKIPYHKGVRLQTGHEIGVYVLVGTYNGTTVIGDIKYK